MSQGDEANSRGAGQRGGEAQVPIASIMFPKPEIESKSLIELDAYIEEAVKDLAPEGDDVLLVVVPDSDTSSRCLICFRDREDEESPSLEIRQLQKLTLGGCGAGAAGSLAAFMVLTLVSLAASLVPR
eukprot:scaffold4161_cov22-Prasinocladus_malaysianus.AAC.6